MQMNSHSIRRPVHVNSTYLRAPAADKVDLYLVFSVLEIRSDGGDDDNDPLNMK